MRLTKRQLKRIIREEYSRLKRRGLIRESLSNRHLSQQVRELINAHYSLDQGYDQEEINDANDTIHRLESEMNPGDYRKATEIAELCLYHNSYATQADVHQVVEEIETACAQLGLTAEDVI